MMPTPAVAIEMVRYTGTDVRCPDCRQWRESLLIFDDGTLRCADCPTHERQDTAAGEEEGCRMSDRERIKSAEAREELLTGVRR